MAKSARASSRKTNNQKLKKNVFGPVEAARTERLSAKLMELVAQQVVSEVRQDKGDAAAMEAAADAAAAAVSDPTPSAQLTDENTESMDVDSATAPGKKRIVKRKVRKGSIVFRRYKDRSSNKRK